MNNQVATIFDASHLIDYAKGELAIYGGKAPKMQQSFRDTAAKLTYEDNPVVVVVTLK